MNGLGTGAVGGLLLGSVQVPVRNTGSTAITRLSPLYLYGVEPIDHRSERPPLVFLASHDRETIPYGTMETFGLWPFPRPQAIALTEIPAGGEGTATLDRMPMLARVSSPLFAPDDLTDWRNLGPLVSRPTQGQSGDRMILSHLFSGQRLRDTPNRVTQALTPEVYIADGQKVTALWHHLGAIRRIEGSIWLCCVMQIDPPILRGITVGQCRQFQAGSVDIITTRGDGITQFAPEDNVRTPFRIANVRNDYATVGNERFVQVAFCDGWWSLTAAEC